MTEDLETARDEGKRLAIIFEQRGCIYCKELHEKVFSDPEVADYIKANFMVVQMNLFGDEEVTDFDGEALPEKEMAKRWGVVFTPTIMFMPDTIPEASAGEAAVSSIPGAFGKLTTLHMFQWVAEKRYEGDEHFQKYHARKLEAAQQN
jgi:thioredoxin-related protein